MASRPGPPLRSYTEIVLDEVTDATSTLLHLSLSPSCSTCPPQPQPPHLVDLAQPRRPRSDTVGTADSRDHHVGEGDDGRKRGESTTADGGLRPPVLLRRTTSAEQLVRDAQDDDEGDDDFSSDDEPFRYRPPSIASTTTSQRSSRRGVRVEDWSDRQSSSFVREVRIKGYHAVGSEGSGFVLFDIEIDTVPPNPHAQGTTIRIHKRYSTFVRLRADILRSFPRLRPLIPTLPPKSSFGTLSSSSSRIERD
ncbi:hypothetical protein JCM8547_006793 [Rhodosporidiobolus lusitaniae]